MKYGVIGLGAVGSIIGGLLAETLKNDVVLIGKPYQIDVIQKKGIKIIGLDKKIENIQITSEFSEIKNLDVIFLCVKSQDTKNAANQMKEHLKKTALIVSLQNGVRNRETIHKITGKTVLAGVVLFNAVYQEPGKVNLTIKGGILLENNGEIAERISNVLNRAGIKTILVDNINGFLWSKLILNLQIAVTALTGQTIKESIIDEDSRNIIIETMKEGIKIVEKSGIHLEKLPGADPKKTIKRLERYNSLTLKIGSIFIGVKKDARNSMWQSLSRRRPTEIDYINGEIVNLAKKNNLKAPINMKLVELVKQVEKKPEFKGKIIVDATGYQAQLLKKAPERWRIEKHIDKRDLIIAYREIIHVRNPLWDVENLHLHFIDRYAPGGYVWIFPWSKDGLYLNIGNGGMACYKTPHFRELLNNYASKVLPNLLADRSIIKSGIWLIPNRRPRHVFVGDGFLAVGDSAIMINPATSEGIGYGLYGAYLASKVIIEALEEDDFSQESLWRYQHAYMTSPYGVRQARLDVLRILMQAHGDDDFQYVIKYKILSSGDLTKARNEDEFMSKLSKFIKAGRMILSRRIKLFKNMKYALDMMKVVRKLYEEYPNTPEGIDDWIRREELIFNEVKDKLKPYNSYPVIC